MIEKEIKDNLSELEKGKEIEENENKGKLIQGKF